MTDVTRAPAARAMATTALVVVVAIGSLSCGKKDAPPATIATGASASSAARDSGQGEGGPPGASAATGSSANDLWQSAASLEPDVLGRLALTEGSVGLVEGATTPERRKIAVHALAFGEDLVALPFLGEVAAQTSDPSLALVAADAASSLAARRRAQVAPEDALEIREGCDRLLAVAKDAQKAKVLRLRVLRTLRMLEDRGCARDLPKIE